MMKKCLLSLGLSSAILMTAAFAQPQSVESELSAAKAFSPALQQSISLAAPVSENAIIAAGYKRQAVGSTQNRKPVLKHTATYASANPDKATIKLVVGDCWKDGSGYQVLIDADAQLCDATADLSGIDQKEADTYYGMAETTIPANASLVFGTTSVRDLQSDSAEIEPGIYDMLVLIPHKRGQDVYAYIQPGHSRLDNIRVEKGYTYVIEVVWISDTEGETITFIEPFGFQATKIDVTDFSCEVETDMDITLTVTNNGSVDMENYEVWYFSAWPGIDTVYTSDTVKETVSTRLEAGKTRNYTFQKKLENITDTTLYVIYAGITPPQSEYIREDNATVRYLIKKDAKSELPYSFDLTASDFLPTIPGAWIFGTTGDGSVLAQANANAGTPLVSACFELEAGKQYRLTYNYWGGALFYMWPLSEKYHVYYGPVSEPMSEWTMLVEEEVYNQTWLYKEVLLNPETTGTYSLYFSAELLPFMGIKNVLIAEVTDKDSRLASVTPGLARLMPVGQANGSFTATATVQNKGTKPLMGVVEVTMNGNVVGSDSVKNVATDAYADVRVPITLSGLKTGDKAQFVFTLKQEGDFQTTDNILEWEMEVGDYEMAYDYVTEDMCMYDANCIGTSSENGISVGIPFSLANKDTLTAVRLAWGERVDMTIGIRIQKWNAANKTLGTVVYENEFRRGASAGIREYALPSIILEPGDYMISIVQQGDAFFSLVADKEMENGGGLYVTSNTRPTFQNNYGTPHIRAVFGPDAEPMAKDVMVQAITQPKDIGLFTENQTVMAVVSNVGYETFQVPVTLMVDGQVISTKTVKFQNSYGRQEVRFTADLSAPGLRELKVFTSLEGDEDPTNDTCVRTVTSMPPANPYVMDFEYCEDFATDNFTPAWKTVDVDRCTSYEINGVDFPHSGEAFGFIAFNPNKVHSSQLPHGGERFGAAFATTKGSNNDWLISPKLKIVAGKEYMNFFVKSASEKVGLEKYNVLVSTTEDILDEFKIIGETRVAPAEWTEVNVDLKAYSGKEVYLAIQCVSEDAFYFMIDDITVCSKVSNENVNDVATQLSLYPNPAREMIVIHAQDANIQRVEIFNISGMTVYQSQTLNTTDYRYSVSDLNAGIYLARVTTDKGVAVMKFIVR